MSRDGFVQTYHNSLSVWVLLKGQTDFERAVPPGAVVTFSLPPEETIEVIPLVCGNGIFGINLDEEAIYQ